MHKIDDGDVVPRLTPRTESVAKHEPEGSFQHCFVSLLKTSFFIKSENLTGRGQLLIRAREEVLAQAMRRLERQLGREINYTVLTPKEFESRRARKDAFLENVWHNKRVPLIGTDEEAKTTRR
jgi:hypothetical protein